MRNPSLRAESWVSDDSGNTAIVWRFDARTPADRVSTATLVKCGRRVHAVRKLGTIRVSKLPHFRKCGEGLVRDPSEGMASKTVTTARRIDDPQDLRESLAFDDEVQRCAQSIGETGQLTTKGITTTEKRTSRILFGRNCWIYSTAIEPTSDEQWDRLWESLEPAYDHVDHIHKPSQFAWSLGLMAMEQLGARCSDQTLTASFGDQSVETRSRGQLIVHGPVIYVADPFHVIDSARTDMERILLPVFVKHDRFAGHREYRFVILTEKEPPERVVDLRVSCAMLGALDDRRLGPPRPTRTPLLSESDIASPDQPEAEHGPQADSAAKQPLEPISDWFRPDLLGSFDNPAIPLSRTVDPAVSADNPAAATTAAALSALRSKVAQVTAAERRWKAASSAWHAEPWICHICKRFKDPIGGIWITEDDILIVALQFPQGVDAKARLSFGPSGAHVYAIEGAREKSVSRSLNPNELVFPADLGRTLLRLGMTPWPENEAAARDQNTQEDEAEGLGR